MGGGCKASNICQASKKKQEKNMFALYTPDAYV